MAGEPKIMDYLSCGRPDVSYHGVKAWRPEFENFRRQIGIMYCGEYGKKPDGAADDSFFVAYNMHWEAHEFALPALKKEMKWYQVAGTEEMPDEAECLKEQKMIEVKARTIILLQGR